MKTKKELKAEYKLKKPIMGVFQVENTTNGKRLIEGSTDISAKWNRHQIELKFGNHRNLNLQKDWNKFTSENFTFNILSELEMKDEKNVNYTQEVKTLEEMILEEMNIPDEMKY